MSLNVMEWKAHKYHSNISRSCRDFPLYVSETCLEELPSLNEDRMGNWISCEEIGVGTSALPSVASIRA